MLLDIILLVRCNHVISHWTVRHGIVFCTIRTVFTSHEDPNITDNQVLSIKLCTLVICRVVLDVRKYQIIDTATK